MKEYTKEPRKPSEAAQESLPEDMIEGRNAVTEALRSGRTINKVFLADGDTDRALGRLAAMAKESGAVVVRVDRRKLNDMSPTGAHQGIMAAVAAHDYATVDDMLNAAQEKGEAPCSSSATSCPIRTTSARSSARQNAQVRTASSSPAAAASA